MFHAEQTKRLQFSALFHAKQKKSALGGKAGVSARQTFKLPAWAAGKSPSAARR
jgi:hypothetical protein